MESIALDSQLNLGPLMILKYYDHLGLELIMKYLMGFEESPKYIRVMKPVGR